MSHFNFNRQMSTEDLQQQVAHRRQSLVRTNSMNMIPSAMHHDPSMDMSGTGNMADMTMMGGDSLDDIIMQNTKEIRRRQSYNTSRPYDNGQNMADGDDSRRTTMMEFGNRNDGMHGFQFGDQTNDQSSRRPSLDSMDVGMGFPDMSQGMVQQNNYSSSMHPNTLTIDTSGNYDMGNDMMGNIMPYSGMGDTTPLSSMFPNSAFRNLFTGTMQDFSMSMSMGDDSGMSGRQNGNQNAGEQDDIGIHQGPSVSSNLNIGQVMSQFNSPMAATDLPVSMSNSDSMDNHMQSQSQTQPPALQKEESGTTATGQEKSPAASKPSFTNVYSSSGFDMLGALMRVATRKNPEIDIGAVDMSCAFVVCDVTQNDCPIIYVSDIFERLTGYNKHEVLGRNCRFLQAPDGKVVPGVKRKYVDDESVYYLKSRTKACREAQRSLINYRKGGQPFMNLLTLIPIPWDTDDIKYIVGFQVDLVEQPSSVAGKDQGGSYTVNYSQGTLPRYVWSPPDNARIQQESGQTISRDDVSQVLQNFNNSSDSEISKRMWDKVLLENTDDVVHVLSLKGLFLYLSPSAKQVLEYDASELVGTALSSVCHPSDIVPVTRELKDTSSGATVNVVFRIRRKKSGYTWFESHGSLCVEQGKGRKCIILVGRERPVYALQHHEIKAAGGIGESEMWCKLSTSGMLLFISSNVRMLLDRQPDDLVGTSIQALMRPESKLEFGRVLERARTGKRVSFKHEVMNKRGQVLQAQTVLYPGDAAEGSKPTFLVGQIRLIKPSSRQASHTAQSVETSQGKSASSSMGGMELSGDDKPGLSMMPAPTGGDTTPKSRGSSGASDKYIMTQAGSAGLPIGSQDAALASDDNIFDELKTTRCTSWQFELRQMEKSNRLLAEELASLLSSKKKRKRRKGAGHLQRDCANCHTRVTPEWRRGPSGNRDLCNSCGLRWAKQVSRGSSEGSSTLRQKCSRHSSSPSENSSTNLS